ncbi:MULTISPECIES: acyl-CoA desaturase [unclassified Coleofasciculus]|uniref:acyl-CoA desaturase n=1 Tax=Cyanophyceae TaxID=3028117 RepID=UPI0016852EEB|nr:MULTISPECIES: acyl-CoA desaturase [unclassified Coleofasciculus]MBD1879235.1 acyl-CoA desaturase [Coleofasciculus sp. FACHB-T130]MBD1895964.1 acyl-CoA desaturase [Coleofasciculus sp. FACHB-129]
MTVATTTKDQEQVRQDSPLRPDWVIIIYMAALHIAALFALFPSNFSWAAVGVAVFFHWVTGGLGITLGFHRLVTHRSFQTPKWLEYFFVLCGTLSCQGGPINWIGIHRLHHLHSDENLDPHDSNKGFWWSHMGWMLYQNPADTDIPRVTKDISGDPVYQFLQNYFIPIQVVLGLILYALGGWPFVVWGIFVRIVAVFHCTWFVNSATHKFGYRTYESEDRSTNCWWVALLTYGEGWHNNHHAFQYSARHGLKWWEIDLTWMTIQFLQSLGLASKVKLVEESKQ